MNPPQAYTCFPSWYNIIYETSRQSRFNARYWMLGAGALGRPRGMVRGGRREEDFFITLKPISMKPYNNICPRMMATCACPRCLLKAFLILQKTILAKQRETVFSWNIVDTGVCLPCDAA